MEWEDFDASGKSNFRKRCDNRWDEVRSNLEPRELEDARDQCDQSLDDLRRVQTDGTECDLLRALYVD